MTLEQFEEAMNRIEDKMAIRLHISSYVYMCPLIKYSHYGDKDLSAKLMNAFSDMFKPKHLSVDCSWWPAVDDVSKDTTKQRLNALYMFEETILAFKLYEEW